MRCISLFLAIAGLCALSACSKSEMNGEERWLEKTERKEVIVFNDGLPVNGLAEEKSFYFQSRQLADNAGGLNESGVYFYKLSGDSLILRSRDKKYYFKMGNDGKSFLIDRFFQEPGGLPAKLEFVRQ